jgi:2'-hydroxyisoflavone reductase
MRETIRSDAEVVWLDGERVLDAGVQPWSELPLWLPSNDYAGMARADISQALAAGLTFRPVGETIADTLAWDRSEPGDRPTLTHDKEQEILATR